MWARADPDFDRALACMFVFERPQRLKVVVHSRNKFGGRAKSENNLLGVLTPSVPPTLHACSMHACMRRGA